MNVRIAALALAAVTGLGEPATAQVAPDCIPGACLPTPVANGRIDPRFRAFHHVLRHFGPDSAFWGPDGLGDARVDGAGAMLRFERRLTEREMADLADAGVEFLERDGSPIAVGRIYGAFVRWEALGALRDHPLLVYAEASWHPHLETPLEVTGAEIGSAAHLRLGFAEQDGAGTVIGDIDTGVDVLHPHLFFADGGVFDWVDVDGDGVLTPGTDAVDYNEDGEADGNEVLRVLDGSWLDRGGETQNDDGVLDVRLDWVYADRNRDGERNVGAAAGFTEFDPGYGEPAFVVDDADRDGQVDVAEKLVLLGTSKVRRFVTRERTWERGEDLIHAAEVDFIDAAMHGTGVSSILVGGQPRAHERIGIAPGAEVVMFSSHMGRPGENFDETPQLADLQAAMGDELDVLNHEWTNPYTAPHDGSGNFEAAMDEARAGGMVQINPLGNLNHAEKHRVVDAAAGDEPEFVFVVEEGFERGDELLPYSSVHGSIFWRGEHLPTLELESPDDKSVVLPLDGTSGDIGADFYQATHNETGRGTHHVVFSIWTEGDRSIQRGEWTIRITDTQVDDRFVGRIADFHSAWAVGVRWAEPTSDVGTLVYPATADAAFGVAAYAGRHRMSRDGTGPGELRGFSGRGPRLDGAPAVDIAAPDDPFAALVGSPGRLDAGFGRSWYTTFGGTSGAAPHVAGAAALLRSVDASMEPAAIERRMSETARADGFTPPAEQLPDRNWGAGKLDVFAALHGRLRRESNEPPRVKLSAEVVDQEGTVRLDASNTSDSDGDSLRYRWDFDYDGGWDQTTQEPVTIHRFESGESARVRLDVHDGEGGVHGAIHMFTVQQGSDDVGPPDAGPRPDTGAEPSPPPMDGGDEPVCGCGSAGEGAASSLLLLLPWLLRPRRRRDA